MNNAVLERLRNLEEEEKARKETLGGRLQGFGFILTWAGKELLEVSEQVGGWKEGMLRRLCLQWEEKRTTALA